MPRKKKIKHLDWGSLEGGLARMMDRYVKEGTLTGDLGEDDFISAHPNAALLGMLYDQRVLAEYAFTGPRRLYERLGHLDMGKIAKMDEDKFKAVFAEKPAVHRFTNKMADYTQSVAGIVAEQYEGDASRIWKGADFPTIEKRLVALPGFGKMKAMKMKYVLHYFGYRDFAD